MTTTAEAATTRAVTLSIVLSILLMIFGFLAIALPTISSVGVVFIVGWLAFFCGLVQLVHAFQSKGIGHIAWKLLIAICYLVVGIYLVAHPLLGLAGLTLALAVFFSVQGLVDIFAYLSTRKTGVSAWMLVDGIITLLLGFVIWNQWPVASLWVMGTLVGIGMVLMGATRLMMALAVRKLNKDQGGRPSQERWAA